MLGRAKSCRWQVFVRRRPPKQGELRTDVSKATMFQGDRAAKGFNFVSGKLVFEWADSRFAKPRKFPKRERFYSFRLYEKNQKYPRGLRTSGLPGTIQSFAGNIFEEASDNTSRNRLFAQNGGEKALNRCEVRVLQRKELERTTKE